MTLSEARDEDARNVGASARREERVTINKEFESFDEFLAEYVTNISRSGVFVRSKNPLPIGTVLTLRFGPEGEPRLEIEGVVVWVNQSRRDGSDLNPGMGVRFISLTPDLREAIVEMVKTVAYLNGGRAN